ncbi:MAG: hypothetical protein AABY32_05330 [Nanoarchaeota archaeon]
MTEEENKQLSHLERIKSVMNMAVERKIPVEKVFNLYNKVNDILYKNLNENSLYNPDIENVTFASVERYFSRLN